MKKAFTLIELLVVIAIIAILAAILFPVFAQAKQAAKQSACLSNNKQLATALYTYVTDYDDTTPKQEIAQYVGGTDWRGPGGDLNLGWMDEGPGGYNNTGARTNWAKALFPYSKSLGIYKCSVAKPAPWVPLAPTNVQNQGQTSYMVVMPYTMRSMTSVDDPSQRAFLQESGMLFKSTQTRPRLAPGGLVDKCRSFDPGDAMANHNGGGHLSFIDGHAKYFKRQAVKFRWLGAVEGTYPAGITGPDDSFAPVATSGRPEDTVFKTGDWADIPCDRLGN